MIKPTTILPDFIKDRTLIADYFKDPLTENETFVIKNKKADGSPAMLSEVLYHLPSGSIHKSDTGMGATTAEILAKRNSIIVEPIRFTTQSKADKHDCLFVGTRIGKKNGTKVEVIEEYLQNKSVPTKKIICVVNSLDKVLEAINNVGMHYSDFFLLFDETDSLQLESTFRKEMNEAFEFYKMFPKGNRACLTATPLAFSDPDLKDEPVIEFAYETPKEQELNLIRTNDYKAQVCEEIEQMLRVNRQQKIFVALNSVSEIMEVIDYLEGEAIVVKGEAKVLCSSNSKKSAGIRYAEIQSEVLPGLVNFATAAYYTGFDINESFHLITIISAGSNTLEISELRQKQIAGRSRKGLFSQTIIYQGEGLQQLESFDIAKLNHLAEFEIQALQCFTQKFGAEEKYLQNFMVNLRTQILEGAGVNGTTLVFEDKNGSLKKAYAGFDSILESSRLRNEIYPKIGGLKTCLENVGYKVTLVDKVSTVSVGPSLTMKKNDRNTIDIIYYTLKDYLDYGKTINPDDYVGFERDAFQLFMDYKEVVEEEYLVNKILSGYNSISGGKKRLKHLRQELDFAITPRTEPLKAAVLSTFELDKQYQEEELKEKMQQILLRSGISASKKEAWLLLRRVFNVKESRKKQKLVSWKIDPTKVVLRSQEQKRTESWAL
jgi:hypothetical protein